MRKHERTIVLVIILVIATPLGYLLGKNINQQKELLSGQTLGQELSGAKLAEYEDIDAHCPVRTVMSLVSPDSNFYIDRVYCAYARNKVDLGEDITGQPVTGDVSKMPHMLIACTTGPGKSVCINTIILSLLYHSDPKNLRFLMIDPKRLELPMYNPIPHLLRRAVTQPKRAVSELEKLVKIMEIRYRDFAREGVRDIDGSCSSTTLTINDEDLINRINTEGSLHIVTDEPYIKEDE